MATEFGLGAEIQSPTGLLLYIDEDDEYTEEAVEEVESGKMSSTASFLCPPLFEEAAKATESATAGKQAALVDAATHQRSSSVRRSTRFRASTVDPHAEGDVLVRYDVISVKERSQVR